MHCPVDPQIPPPTPPDPARETSGDGLALLAPPDAAGGAPLPNTPIPADEAGAVARAFDPAEPLGQLPGETARAWETFLAYYALGPGRSLTKLNKALGNPRRSKYQTEKWSGEHLWQARIAAQVRLDAERLAERMVEEKLRGLDNALDTVRFVLAEARAEWQRSKESLKSTVREFRPPVRPVDLFGEEGAEKKPEAAAAGKPQMERVSLREEHRCGNPRYLEAMLQASAMLCKILGLEPPSKTETTHELGEKAVEALRGQRNDVLEEAARKLAGALTAEQLRHLSAEFGLALEGPPRGEVTP